MSVRIKHKIGINSILILIAVTSIVGCTTGPKDVDVSHINLDLKIDRFEQDLADLKNDSLDQQLVVLQDKYGDFFTFFTAGIINVGRIEDASFKTSLMGFVTDGQINDVLSEVNRTYANLNSLEEELEEAFKHYMHYFPGKEVPQIATYISGFNSSLVATDQVLGIGLDMYLGEESKYYQMLMLPQYKIANMKREMIVADCMRGWLSSDMDTDNSNSTLLKQMINQGKVLYFLDLVMPHLDDKYKIGFTDKQLIWCKNSEGQMWAHLVDEEVLYTTDFTQIIKYIGEAPFTVGFPEGSPGRSGWWIGWQIVKSFMDKNEEIGIQELLQIEDAQQILSKSNYKPRR